MKIDAAKDLLETVFGSSYSCDNFKRLASEVFNGYERKEQIIETKEEVKNFTNLGLFEDNKGKKIAVFEVELLSENSLHRARVKQRNLIANQLKIHNFNSALCTFYHPNQEEWRLSFITREEDIDPSSEKLKFIEHLSPSRRQSFIAGPNEGTHTVKKQFLSRIESDNKPSFDDIASIFEIEAVNNDFYEHYKELYLRLTEELEKFMKRDPVIAADFQEKEVSTSDFAKKTLGQFVFLYFLQKKGWIKDKAHPNEVFSFSKLFDDRKKFGNNFFNEVMEPIFYESLAKKEPNLKVYSVLTHYEFPYLNGGLFEPIRDYNWEKTNIVIPDTFFKNDNRAKDGSIGDGLLDVFNRFNFTVHENDALEKDIAVDPEMLGKVFENLLDIKDRKSKGAFYTPREIVQYMCQESLINYLDTEIGDEISSEALNLFITNHTILEAKDMKGAELGIISENAMVIDQLLANVKICDPAVGSGAFPMGMLSEIVSARNSLQPFLSNKRSIYDLKLHTIGQSLYGVDLDPSAVDIARLRFWLSLIIEEDIPTPLPNLEHKLMQGNSLLSSYEGIELFNNQFLANEDNQQKKLNIINEEIKVLENEIKDTLNTLGIDRIKEIKKNLSILAKKRNKILAENTTSSTTRNLFDSEDTLNRIRQLDLLQKKISQFLLPNDNYNKEDLKIEIENIKWDLIQASVDNKSKTIGFQQLKDKRIQPFFLWQLEFADVFANKNGFDIVIGNPPYLRVQGIEREISEQYKSIYTSATGSYDLYVLFVEKGLEILSESGVLNFIIPHKWVNSAFGKGLREISKTNIKKIISFEAYQVFNASTYTSLVWFDKTINNKFEYVGLEKNLETNLELEKYLINLSKNDFTIIENQSLTSETWVLTNKIVKGILDKLNKKPLRVSDIFEKIFQGIASSKDSVYFLSSIIEKDNLLLECYSQELDKRILIERELVKPLLKGDDVHRYQSLVASKAVIFPYYIFDDSGNKNARLYTENEIRDKFPNGYDYLKQCESILRNREKGRLINDDFWFRYIYPKSLTLFNKEKIIQPDISLGGNFAYDVKGEFYTTTTLYGYIKYPKIKESYKFYMAILNSHLLWWFLQQTGTVLANNYFRFMPRYIEAFPIPEITNIDETKPIEDLVDKVITDKKKNIDSIYLEKEIDKLVYQLYGLTDDEIAIIEKTNN